MNLVTGQFGWIRRTSVAAVMALCVGAVSAEAATITFNFTNNAQGGGSYGQGNDGNTRTFTQSGMTVTATAWSVDTSAQTDRFATSALGFYSGYGLGVCNDQEIGQRGGCGSPEHQVDNQSSWKDYVLFQFGSSVDVSTVHIESFGDGGNGQDTDVSYWFGTAAAGLNLANVLAYGGLPAGLLGNFTSDGNGERDVTISSGPQFGNTLLFGARLDQTNDFFKIQGLTLTTSTTITTQAVPEPSTLVLFGAGLFLLARQVRRRTIS